MKLSFPASSTQRRSTASVMLLVRMSSLILALTTMNCLESQPSRYSYESLSLNYDLVMPVHLFIPGPKANTQRHESAWLSNMCK